MGMALVPQGLRQSLHLNQEHSLVSGKGFCLPMEMLGWLGDVDPFPILSGEPLFQRRESEGSHLDF